MNPPSKRNIGTTERCANPNGCITNEKRCDLFVNVRWLLFLFAVRPIPFDKVLPPGMHGYSALINVVLEIFLHFSVIHIFVLSICTIYFNYDHGDLEFLISSGIQVLLYFWAIVIKVAFRHIYPELVDGILVFVNEEYVLHSAVGFTYVTMKESFNQTNRGVKMFASSCFLAVIFRIILPIIYNERTLPLTCWYPVDYKAPIIFEIAYLFQILAQLQLSAAFSVSSAYFVALCFLLSGQFDVLNCSLKNIMATTYIYMGASKDELIELRDKERIPDEYTNEFFVAKELPFDLDCLPHLLNAADTMRTRSFREAFKYAIEPCVKHHIFILNALRKLESLYNKIWLSKTIEVTFAMCMCAFHLVKSSNDTQFLQVFCLGQYTVLGLLEIFMIYYAGEIIYVNSQRCDEALLRSPWYPHLREIRADFLLFLIHAQRSFELTAGKFNPLRLDKFRGIITTSFSFFTLLQTLDERN